MFAKSLIACCLPLAIILFLAGSGITQSNELRRLSITPVDAPASGIPVLRDHPDKAAIIIESTLTNLDFDSNMAGIVDQYNEPGRGRYILIIEPFNQNIQVNVPGFITGRFRVGAPRARDVFYYQIEPEERMPDLIPVNFNVTPHDARLFVDDQITETNQTVQLPPGEKQIRLEREGYRVIDEVIVVSMDNVLFNYEMGKIDIVLVQIRTNVQDAAVLIDGSEVGRTDNSGGSDFFVYPGTYALTVSQSGYITYNRTLQVNEDKENRITMELNRNLGTLSIQVSPSDAAVQLNRRDYSRQSRIELAPGRYLLEVEKQGYEPHSETIEIGLNELIIRSVRLQAYTGSLQFTVSPTNASFSLRDPAGRTVGQWEGSRLLSELKAGYYTLHVEAPGYRSQKKNIHISKNETLEKHLVLNTKIESKITGIRGSRSAPNQIESEEEDVDRAFLIQLDWEGDINRTPLLQPMPNYVPQADVVISVRFEVRPDGTIGRLQPIIKADSELELEVLRTLRTWRFSRLPGNIPQESQFGVVTFRFLIE